MIVGGAASVVARPLDGTALPTKTSSCVNRGEAIAELESRATPLRSNTRVSVWLPDPGFVGVDGVTTISSAQPERAPMAVKSPWRDPR